MSDTPQQVATDEVPAAWEPVGQVLVETGRIAIVDPCHAKNIARAERGLESGMLHIQPTELGDGFYPIFRFTEGGHEYLAVRLTLAPGLTSAALAAAWPDQPAGK